MSLIVLTPELAYAAGTDAGNAHMRKAGRTKWNEDDYKEAARETNRLFDILDAEIMARATEDKVTP